MTPRVVLRRVSESGDASAQLRAWLSADERAEMARYLREEDRDRFALARATLREEAGRALGIAPERVQIRRDGHGKPALADAPELACNVSHSGDLVAVAIGRTAAVGVDVESHRIALDLDAVAGVIMTERELAAFAQARDRAAAFFRQWCFKEALVKALGTGLTREPRRFEILFDPDPRARFVGPGEDDLGAGWNLAPLDVPPGYSGALAWR